MNPMKRERSRDARRERGVRGWRGQDIHIWFHHKLNLQLISSQIVEEIKFHTPLVHSWM